MKLSNIAQAVVSYQNGNISDTKKVLQKMSKYDLLEFVVLLGEELTMDGKPQYLSAISKVQRLLVN